MSTATPVRTSPPGPASPRRLPGAAPVPGGATIDPFKVIRRHLLLIVASLVIGGALGTVAFFLLARHYSLFRGQVLFQVTPGVARADEVSTGAMMDAAQVELIAATELELALHEDTIATALQKEDVRRTRWWQETYGSSVAFQEAALELQKELQPRMVAQSSLFAIEWTSPYRNSVPVVLNAIAETHRDKTRNRAADRFRSNRNQFLQQERNTLALIDEKERTQLEFIRRNGILTLDDPRFNDVMQALDDLNRRQADVEGRSVAIEELIVTIRGKIEGNLVYSEEDQLQADADPSVAAQIQRVEGLRFELESARRSFAGEEVAQVRNLRNQFEVAQSVLEQRRRDVIIRNLNGELRQAINERRQLDAVRDQLDEEIRAKQQQQQELSTSFASFKRLERELQDAQEQLARDRESIKELELLQAREDATQADIVLEAQTPRGRHFPKITVMVPLGVLLVGGLTVAGVFLRELSDRRVRSASDLDVIPGAVVLGVVPEAAEDPTKCRQPELAVWAAPTSVMAESYRQIAHPLLRTLGTYDLRTLVLAGGMPRAGTTSVISNLGASAAAAGRSVVIVDANFRRPRLASVMGGDDAAPGLGDLLTGRAELDQVVHAHECGCHWIGAGTAESRIVERLGTVAVEQVVARLATRYDLIVFDAPPAVVAGRRRR